MKQATNLFIIFSLFLSFFASADPATYNEHWQTNKNVTITKIYVHWDTSATRVVLSNGEICHVVKEDKELYSAVLSMHAQNMSGEFICQVGGAGTFNGTTDRRLHRMAY